MGRSIPALRCRRWFTLQRVGPIVVQAPGERVNRSEQVRAAIVAASEGRSVVEAICATACRLLGAESAAVSLATSAGPVTAEGSDAGAMRLDMAQTVAGDGPLLSGMAGDLPLVVGDLHDAARRWPGLSDALAGSDDGLGSMIIIPLRSGSARLGVLSVYRRVAGDLDTEQYADAVVLAGEATGLLLEKGVGSESDPVAAAASMGSPIVQQAVGMLAERHGVTVHDAQVRLRAMAFGRGEPIEELAGRIVRREVTGDGPW